MHRLAVIPELSYPLPRRLINASLTKLWGPLGEAVVCAGLVLRLARRDR